MSKLFTVILISGMMIIPCTTKVSEWVLLNVIPEDYQLLYYRGVTSPADSNEKLSGELSGSNMRYREVKNESGTPDWYGLYYKRRLVAKYNGDDGLKNISTSPLREKIASEIMSGKLCVMLFLRSDDQAKDEKRKEVLLKTVKDSPFRDVITIAEHSRKSVEESHFVSMLLNVESDLKGIIEPMLFGIFGRFRALEPLVAGGITAENIGYMIQFLTADCSCLIKDELPGADILYKGKWEYPVPALVNRILDENPSLQHR
jgi:hypothetical protein